jgi:hypothetical protein
MRSRVLLTLAARPVLVPGVFLQRSGFRLWWAAKDRQGKTDQHHPYQIVFLNFVVNCKLSEWLEKTHREDYSGGYGAQDSGQ